MGKPGFNFLFDVFKGDALLWDLEWLLDVVGLPAAPAAPWMVGAGDPHHLRAPPSPGDARATPHLTHRITLCIPKAFDAFPALGGMLRFFHARFYTHPCSWLPGGQGEAAGRAPERRAELSDGLRGQPSWPEPCFLPGHMLGYCGIRQRQALLTAEREHATGWLAPVRDICVNQRLCK